MKLFLKSFLLMLMMTAATTTMAMDPNACKKASSGQHSIKGVDGTQKLSTLNYNNALALFNELKNPKHRIPYLNAQNHCDIRGHKISMLLFEKYNLSTTKVFLEAQNEEFYGAGVPSFMTQEFSDTDNRNVLMGRGMDGQSYTWKYHTAPALCVRNGNKDELYVFDLSLFNQPVPYSVWKKTVSGHLPAKDVKAFSGSMFSIYPSQNRAAPTQFAREDKRRVENTLNEDWASHLRSLARLEQATASSSIIQSTTF